jgi:hypothetical protein
MTAAPRKNSATKSLALDSVVDIDLDAMRAARLEASGSSISVKWGGNTYQVPPTAEWPLDVIALIEKNDFTEAMKQLFSPDDWDKISVSRPSLGDMRDLFNALAKISGFEEGNH